MINQPERPYELMLATHVLTYGPAQALRDYLIQKKKKFAFLGCPFPEARQPKARLDFYDKGEMVETVEGHGHATGGLRLWLKDAWFVFRWGRKILGKDALFIGVNNLNAAIGILLRRLGFGGRVIYYVIDYTPRRFKNKLINAVYQRIVRFALHHSDAVWNLSRRMQDVHTTVFGADAAKQQLVPVGIDHTFLKPVEEKDIQPKHMVMISTLYEDKGIQLAIAALEKMNEATLTIVGEGPYEQALKKLVQEKHLQTRVSFITRFTREELFHQIAVSRVALATYVPSKDSYTYYADPSKPKEYLACGTPVVITRVPWIAEEVEKRPMGVAIEYDVDDLVRGCRRLMDDDYFWKTCRNNALAFVKDCGYTAIYRKAFGEFMERGNPSLEGVI